MSMLLRVSEDQTQDKIIVENFLRDSDNKHYERDDHSSEKGRRLLKTPAQVQALEKFYNDYKYPSDMMKLEFGQQIGLSEKQVSGWFCHRRSKDKKLLQGEICANKKQNFPNGAMHESTSGLRQESCNSTKQGDRQFDIKEVESKRFHDHNSSAIISRQRGQHAHNECYGVADDRSSGSSTASYERLLKKDVISGHIQPRYLYWNENDAVMETKGVENIIDVMDMRSSYLQADIESTAVSSVKLRLGRQYREDGPPLSVDFDSLPPGAFDSSFRNSNYEPYYVGDSILSRPRSTPVIVREPKMPDKHRGEMMSNGSYRKGSAYGKRLQRFNNKSELVGCQLIPEISDTKSIAQEASDAYRSDHIRSFYQTVGGGYDNNVHAFHRNGLKATSTKPLPCSDHNYSSVLSQREHVGAKFSKPAVKRCKYVTEDTMQPRRPLKKKKINTEFHENLNIIRSEMLVKSSPRMARKIHGKEFHLQEVAIKNSLNSVRRKPTIRYSQGKEANCYEDTSGGTSSVD